MADRAEAYADWLVKNQAQRGSPEFEKVASAYKQLRTQASQPDVWQAGSERTPFTAPKVTGNRTLDIAIEPVTGYPERWRNAWEGSKAMTEHAANAIASGDPEGLIGIVPGVLGMAAAPVSAAVEPVSRPINEYVSPILQDMFGMAPEVSTPVLTSLIPGLGITKVPTPKAAPALFQAPKPRVNLPEMPTNQELRTVAGRKFKEADAAGVIYKGSGLEKARTGIFGELEEAGFDADLHPRVKAVLKRLDVTSAENPDGNITLKGLEIVRRVAMNAAKSPDKQERFLAWKAIDGITQFIHSPDAADILMGDAKRGAQALADAREIWARVMKSETIDLAIETAFTRKNTTGSGANLDNAVRQNVRKILGKDEKPRGFSADEVAALKEIANGTPLRNALRLVGKASPTGVVSGGFSLGAIAALPGGLGFLVPIAGFLSKIAGDKMTVAGARALSDAIRGGDTSARPRIRSAATRQASRGPQNPLRALAPPQSQQP